MAQNKNTFLFPLSKILAMGQLDFSHTLGEDEVSLYRFLELGDFLSCLTRRKQNFTKCKLGLEVDLPSFLYS